MSFNIFEDQPRAERSVVFQETKKLYRMAELLSSIHPHVEHLGREILGMGCTDDPEAKLRVQALKHAMAETLRILNYVEDILHGKNDPSQEG